MDVGTRKRLIDRYKDGYRAVTAALEDMSESQLDRRPAPGKWSPREIVHHLADSEMTSAIRLRRLIAEDNPTIVAYDEKEFARRLFYDRPIEASLEAFKSARLSTATILERMSDADWTRGGTHTESGRYTAETWLEIYAKHAHDHAEQIRRARSAAR
ncbi:MAG TPA: DinB family protein [Acidobacteriota bacterium]|nr:DinB family protein [Acidobacteriota bacterium]